MFPELIKCTVEVGHFWEHACNDLEPPSALGFFIGRERPAVGMDVIGLKVPLEPATDRFGIKLDALAAGSVHISPRYGRLGRDQGTDGVKDNP